MDGGGLRGIMHGVLIERIMKLYPDFLDQVDVFAGCSGGALFALGLAKGYTPSFGRHIFELAGNKIFTKKTIKNVNTAKYTNKWLKIACDEVWGTSVLRDIPRNVVIPAFQLDNNLEENRSWQPKIFHNLKDSDENGSNDRAADVVLRSISAPTYFPSYQGYIDGGVFAHNPSYCTLSLLMSKEFNVKVEKVIILSLGTGIVRRYLENTECDW
jgi:patatin-like phospholipase/acyl hydrolase